jgi:hypothetical protein
LHIGIFQENFNGLCNSFFINFTPFSEHLIQFPMKIKTLALTILSSLLMLGILRAQDESFLGLCLGTAIPQGTFSGKDYQNKQSGYANTGFLFSFDAAWFPDDYLGVGATVTYASNNPDKKKYEEDFMQDLLIRYPTLGEILDENFVFDYGVWKYLNLYIGPNFTFPAGRFNFDLRAMAGLTLAWEPSQTIDATYQSGSTFSTKVEPKAVPTVGYSVGGGIRYAMKSGFVLRVMTEYANSKPTFERTERVIDPEGLDIEEIVNEVEMPIKNIHVGIGIAYNFEL